MSTAGKPNDVVLFAGVSLKLGTVCRHLLRSTRVPYTIALLILGIALGSLEYGTKGGLGKLGAGIRIWANINPDLLLAAFLPALLFESAFSMDAHQIKMTRVVVVGVCYPLLGYFGYGLDFKDATVLVWSRLRGVVSLSQAMSVKRASDAAQPLLKPEVGTMFLFFTGGIVFLTLILNGSTTQFLLHILGMDKLSATKLRMLNYTRHEMLNKALDAFGDLRDDEELGPADWVCKPLTG
ncbi:hypothetical protein ACQ4PT_050536 [Festuca glaucescens]